MKSRFLTVFLLICFSGFSQIDDFQKEIIEYLNINGSREELTLEFYEVFPKLQRSFKDKEIPEEAWEKLKDDEEAHVDELVKMVSFAYRKHFTRDDIEQLTDFYSTKAAQKRLSNKELTEEEKKEIETFLKSDVAKKYEKKRKDLNKDIEPIKAQWARELFGAKMKQLIKEGYL